jgi:aminoglycoside phosphotransferase family enzyme/predicted kinase
MSTLKSDFLAQGFELRETHISQVFLTGTRVYKTKKPVQLGFLDFTKLAQRQHFCEVEVTLNRRLAPDVYLGVTPITRDAAGVHHVGGDGEPVEFAVEMVRLPDRDAADVRLREGRLGLPELRLLAGRLARFHAAARCDAETAQYGSLGTIETNVRENFEQTRESAPRAIDARELQALEHWQTTFVRDQSARLEARVAQQRIRDGHGDLRLEHCYLDEHGGVAIIDCIEFNERFRYGDTCADVAFLAMDLNLHGRQDLSEFWLGAYARAAHDYDLYGVVDFYQSYRAFVRGKVSSMLEADDSAEASVREHAAADARKYYLLSRACTRESLEAPTLYAVGGVIATGKSAVAQQLGLRVNAPVVDADSTRKQLAGVDALTPLPAAAFAGHYTQAATEQVYAELRRCAAIVLESGRSAVLEASFRERAQRTAAVELARQHGVPFLFIECAAPAEVCRARLAQRARGPSVSDGRLELFDTLAASFEPIDELASDQLLRVDTSGTLEASMAQVDATLNRAVGSQRPAP